MNGSLGLLQVVLLELKAITYVYQLTVISVLADKLYLLTHDVMNSTFHLITCKSCPNRLPHASQALNLICKDFKMVKTWDADSFDIDNIIDGKITSHTGRKD